MKILLLAAGTLKIERTDIEESEIMPFIQYQYPIVDEIDINRWDLRKALQLLWRSNPGIVEWLQSPIVYVDDGVFAPAARALLSDIYSPIKGVYHYVNMAKNNYRSYLKADIVPLKKYFYVLRPLLAIMWLEKYQVPAPIEFHKLCALLTEHPDIKAEIDLLLERKKQSQEKEMAPAIPALNQFIETLFAHYEELKLIEPDSPRDIEQLNKLFRQFIAP